MILLESFRSLVFNFNVTARKTNSDIIAPDMNKYGK